MDLNILAGKGLYMLRDLWAEAPADGRSQGVNSGVFKWFRYGGYGIFEGGTVLSGRLVTLLMRIFQSGKMLGRRLCKTPKKKPAIKWVHIFFRWTLLLEPAGERRAVFCGWDN